jgi:diguanylate cyclase (GGDEF)-like protein
MGQNEQALEYSLKSVVGFDRGNHLIGKSEALDTLGAIYLALGQVERAMDAHLAGLELARNGLNRGQEINNLLGIARLQQRNGELQAAIQTLLDILEITQAMEAKQEEANANEQLAEIYKQLGDYPAALHYFEAFHSISIKLSNEKAERRLQQMQVQYEVESIRKQADQYREQASTDALTGLMNRRRFFELAEQSLHTAQVERRPLAVMMLDIDHFKQINDLHGHPFGDAVLVEVASRLRRSLRSDDWAGRYGGDELLVFLLDANCETAKAIARRFRQAIVHEAVTFEAARQEITISLGLVCYDGRQELSLAELVKQADQALMQAKQFGRNQVMLYEAGQG